MHPILLHFVLHFFIYLVSPHVRLRLYTTPQWCRKPPPPRKKVCGGYFSGRFHTGSPCPHGQTSLPLQYSLHQIDPSAECTSATSQRPLTMWLGLIRAPGQFHGCYHGILYRPISLQAPILTVSRDNTIGLRREPADHFITRTWYAWILPAIEVFFFLNPIRVMHVVRFPLRHIFFYSQPLLVGI